MYSHNRLILTCAIFTVIIVPCPCVVGDDSAQIDGSEEVSIEAVEDDGTSPKICGSPFYSPSANQYWKEEEEKELQGKPLVTPALDNSTAVATVYSDMGKTVSSNATASNTTHHNITSTPRYQRVKVTCAKLYPEETNFTAENAPTVELVNMTYLLHGLLVSNPTVKARSTPSNCTIVMFYTYWCPWSAKAAPHFNALPRAFRNIRFAAIDSSVHTAINTYFGVLSVPSIVLFFNGKILAKFNDTSFNVNQFGDFVTTFTDQKPSIRLNVTSMDFVGPVPSSVSKGHDWYLYLSWIFIVTCFAYYISKTAIWHRILELVQNSWREAEAVASVPPHHFHQE